jgi:biopolymer transport protein TolR
MGGGAMPEGGGGHGKKKKKALDAVINVVPAIDLLSCCISFLLMTAVWTQISKLQVQQSAGPGPGDPPKDPPVVINLTMTDRGFMLSVGTNQMEIAATGKTAEGGAVYNMKELETKLTEVKKQFPETSALTLAAEDAVIYQDLVRVIDTCIGAQFQNVSVTAAGGV